MFINFDPKYRLDKYEPRAEEYEGVPIQEGLIMFYGDSYFTRWRTEYGNNNLEDDIRAKDGSVAVINHGIGGACFDQLLYYYPRLVRPWKPKYLVLKSYGNDNYYGYTTDEILMLMARVCDYARIDGVEKIYLVKPMPSFKGKDIKSGLTHMNNFSERLKQYAQAHDDIVLVYPETIKEFYQTPEDVGDFSKLREELYIDDKVHLSPEGYELYAKFWRETLKDIL